MSNLGFIVMTAMDNVSANLSNNPFYAAFIPYFDLLGSSFFALFFGFIAAGIYVGGANKYTLMSYFVLITIFMGFILPSIVGALFGLFVGFIFAVILYNVIFRKKSE